MTNQEEATDKPEPRQTRRDVSWSVMFRLARTGVWVEWSSGHRDPSEAVRAAECLVPIDSVADIRFERVVHQRDMFDLHGLPDSDTPAAPDRAAAHSAAVRQIRHAARNLYYDAGARVLAALDSPAPAAEEG